MSSEFTYLTMKPFEQGLHRPPTTKCIIWWIPTILMLFLKTFSSFSAMFIPTAQPVRHSKGHIALDQ